MNEKEKQGYLSKEDNKKKNNVSNIDYKLPYDMKTFWKNIQEKFFTFKDHFDPSEILQKVLSLGKYGKFFYIKFYKLLEINADSIFLKIGFPKNFGNFMGKSQDYYISK